MRVASEKVEHQGLEHRTLVAATTAGGLENRHATLKAGVPPSKTTLTSGNRPEKLTHTPQEPQSTARLGTKQARHSTNRIKATGQRTRARTPHHHAGTTARGSHREQGDAPKRIANRRGFATDGGVHTISTSETERKAPGIVMYKMTGCACNVGSRAGQCMSYQF